MSISIVTCPISPSWSPSSTANRRLGVSSALAIACVAFCLWFGGRLVAHAGELVIDLTERARGSVQHDNGEDPTSPRVPAASYRSTGERVLERVQVSPWPPVQGQTLSVAIRARNPLTFTLTFQGRPYVVHGSRGAGWSLVPIPPLTKPGYVPLVIHVGDQRLTLNVPVREGEFSMVNIPAATSTPILSNTEKVNTEAARMTEIFAKLTPGGWNLRSRFRAPLRGTFRHSSAYGSRRTYGDDPTVSAHAGEDYSAPAGTPVYAPAAGRVMLAEGLFVRGNAVVLDHGNTVFTGYWHLSEVAVKAGEDVVAGQLIGKVGSTGLSTGAHLHWELRIGGMAVDPLQWVRG